MNYPIIAYGAFSPNMPTKLYEDPRQPTTNMLDALPRGLTAYVSCDFKINDASLNTKSNPLWAYSLVPSVSGRQQLNSETSRLCRRRFRRLQVGNEAYKPSSHQENTS